MRFSLELPVFAKEQLKNALRCAKRHNMAVQPVAAGRQADEGAFIADVASSRMTPPPALLRYAELSGVLCAVRAVRASVCLPLLTVLVRG